MKKIFKYEEIIFNIEEKINKGTLESGQKLPSVRNLCSELNVSPSTVFKAYYELEAKGLIEARNKSGYYVNLNTIQLQKINQKNQQVTFTASNDHEAKNILEMIEEIEKAKLGDIKMDFSSATPSSQMLPIEKLNKSIRASLTKNKNNFITYENPLGSIPLRKHISLQSIKNKHANSIDKIIITAGCLEAINICFKILIKKGDSILVDSLIYYNIISLLKSMDIEIHTYDFHNSSNFNSQDFEKTLQSKNIKLCLIASNFQNPQGFSISTSAKKSIVNSITKHSVYVIEDDIYSNLYFGKNQPTTLKQFDMKGLIYYCSSFSKTLAPGFRVGFCLAGNKHEEFAKYKRLLSIGTNSVTQAALANFMETGRYDFHLKNLRKKLHLNMLAYGNVILKYFPNNIYLKIPEGGYVFWIGFPEGIDGYQLYKQVLKEKILIIPGEIFSFDGSHKNFIRISFSNSFNDEVYKSLQTIGKIAHRFMEKSGKV